MKSMIAFVSLLAVVSALPQAADKCANFKTPDCATKCITDASAPGGVCGTEADKPACLCKPETQGALAPCVLQCKLSADDLACLQASGAAQCAALTGGTSTTSAADAGKPAETASASASAGGEGAVAPSGSASVTGGAEETATPSASGGAAEPTASESAPVESGANASGTEANASATETGAAASASATGAATRVAAGGSLFFAAIAAVLAL